MRKMLMAAAAAATLVAGSAAPAQAQSHVHMGNGHFNHFSGRGFRGGFRHDRGDAFAAGVFGFGLGAALASPYYYNDYYYDYPGYYGYDYDDYGYYGSCYSSQWVWNPYYGRYVRERVRYAC